jgi:hypothetical protein
LNIANKRDFNRVEIEGQPPDVFEQAMASFEGELGPALVRILEAQSLDNENDRAVLLNAIALFSTRNPRQRETVREFHENTSHIMMELATATKERWEAQMRKVRKAGEIKDVQDVPYEELRDFVDLADFLYQRDKEFIVFARPDLAVSGMGSSSEAPAVDTRALSAA